MNRVFKILLICFVSFFLGAAILFSILFNYLAAKLNVSPAYAFNSVRTALFNNSFSKNDKVNFLVLGLDRRDDWLEKTETTDTIILSSLDTDSGKISLVSLPRDIWNYNLNAKINNIYPISSASSDRNSFIKNKFTEITGVKIDRLLVVTTKDLSQLADLLGGIDVYLDKGFIDHKYPNPEYIKHPSPKTPVYKTVEFPSGWVHLDSSNISEFIRSRKGSESAADGGTDIGRIKRQQLLLETLLEKLKEPSNLKDLNKIAGVYGWYHSLQTDFTDSDILSLALILKQNLNNLEFQKKEIPIGITENDGVIYHPDKFINKQWVYIVSGENYSKLKSFLSSVL